MICWSCKEPVGAAVCVGCTSLQPPPVQPDLYEILGIERRWHLDRKVLDKAWRAKSRMVHPDRFAGKAAVMRRMALQWTAALNDARLVLRDPESRGWYLATGERGFPERGGPQPEQDFLMQMFELRMAHAEGEDVSPQTDALLASTMDTLERIFTAWEQGEGSLDEAPKHLVRLRYLNQFRLTA